MFKSVKIKEKNVKKIMLNEGILFDILPYEKLEYIEGTGNQYIKTGIFQKYTEGKTIIKSRLIGSVTTRGLYGFLNRQNLEERINLGITGIGWFVGSGSATPVGEAVMEEDAVLEWDRTNQKASLNGVEKFVENITTSGNIYESYLFIRNNGSNAPDVPYSWQGRVYYLKEYDVNNKLILHLIPVKLKTTGEIGMWDLVTNTFMGNSGTGTFIEPSNSFIVEQLNDISVQSNGNIEEDKSQLNNIGVGV